MKIKFLLICGICATVVICFSSSGYAVPKGVKVGHGRFWLKASSEIIPFRFTMESDRKNIKVGESMNIKLKFENVSSTTTEIDFSKIVISLYSKGKGTKTFSLPKNMITWRVNIIPNGFIGVNFFLTDLVQKLSVGNYSIMGHYQLNKNEGINSVSDIPFIVFK